MSETVDFLASVASADMDKFDLISFYFNLGMNYCDILQSLAVRHGVIVSKRHLISCSKSTGSTVDNMLTSGSYRFHYAAAGRTWKTAWLQVDVQPAKKEDVRLILAALDPHSSDMRRSRRLIRRQYFALGPNYIWHADSYDKLKPYGICINDCIDGFSRKIIWLKAAHTSSDPRVIGGYFLEAVEQFGGCPRIVRTDLGTENVVVRDIQTYLRHSDADSRSGAVFTKHFILPLGVLLTRAKTFSVGVFS